MSRLAERLRRLERSGSTGPVSEVGPTEDLRARLDRVLGQGRVVPASRLEHRARAPVELFVEGRRVETERGTAFVTEWHAAPTHWHGLLPVGDLAHCHRGEPGELFPEHLARVETADQIAFLDTEMTGLADGAGTVPFLVGVGRWVSDARLASEGFRVVQLFLEDLDREAALLSVLAAELEGIRCLVTYNGRPFDIPLLENRHVLNRMGWPVGDATHLDLLPPARTLWRHAHPDCRLATLERSVLGFERRGDIPGSEIPALYRQYLRHGATKRLESVFRHNRHDLLSLAGLLWAAGRAAAEGAAGAGLLHARRGRSQLARPLLEAGLREDLPRGLRRRALKELSLALKRESAWEQALVLWDELRTLDRADPFPVVEASKALEHRLGDAKGALVVVEEALAEGMWAPRDRDELERRRSRLRRKISRG